MCLRSPHWEGVMYQDTCGLCVQHRSPQCPRATAIRSAALLMHTGDLWCSRHYKAGIKMRVSVSCPSQPKSSHLYKLCLFNLGTNHEIENLANYHLFSQLGRWCFFSKTQRDRSGALFPIFLLQSLWDPIPKVSRNCSWIFTLMELGISVTKG